MHSDARPLILRPYRPSDEPSVRDVCLRTAESGADATGLYVSDALMPDIFASPYLAFAPDLAFVLDPDTSAANARTSQPAGATGGADRTDPLGSAHTSGQGDQGEPGVQGYVLAVADTRRFVEWFRAEWVPRLARDYQHVVPWRTRCELIRHLGFTPERMLLPELDRYPAHLHIDILPAHQRRGWGRRLIDALIAALRARGVPGLHLVMAPDNHQARRFYDRLGFHELPSSHAGAPALGIQIR